LANITEFGKTPLYSADELHKVGVSMILYPLSAHRAMSLAAQKVYLSILEHGHQRNVLHEMQTREDLYSILNYYDFERRQ
jgi:methylisocitrate lyase